MKSQNQDWALAEWRKDASRDDPPFYSVKEIFGDVLVWMSVYGNVGWYRPEIKDGELVGIRSLAFPPPSEDESPKARAALNHAMQWVNPKQRKKIVHLVNQFKCKKNGKSAPLNASTPSP